MPYIHSLPLMLFVLFDIAYVVVCIALYSYFIREQLKKPKRPKAGQKVAFEKIGIIVLTLFSIYQMNKWILLQAIDGCAQTFFWNPICYDLNQLNRLWLIIIALIGINAIVLTIVLDLRAQSRRVVDRKR